MTRIFDPSTSSLSDDQLLSNVQALAGAERSAMAQLIAALAELDRRKLFLRLGYPSLFNYCTQALHLSEHAAYGRIEAVRAVSRVPEILNLLADGSVTLTTVCLLAPLLTADNHVGLLTAARHKSRREVERLVAEARPKPDVPSVVRKLPSRKATEAIPSSILDECAVTPSITQPCDRVQVHNAAEAVVRPAYRPTLTLPIAADRYKIQFTASRAAYEKLQRAQSLLRHLIPNGDPAAVFERALDVLLADLEKRKLAATSRPGKARDATPGSRHIPAAVRRSVWQRDGARCAFVGTAGRCAERGFLELHHVVPFARGGDATTANIELRCRAHNAYEAELAFGSSSCGSVQRNTTQFESIPNRIELHKGTRSVRFSA